METSAVDMVGSPPHYTSHPSGVEAIAITEHMNFCVGNAMKYLWRAGLKNDAIEDLKKARWYVDREIQRLEKRAAQAAPEPDVRGCAACAHRDTDQYGQPCQGCLGFDRWEPVPAVCETRS